MNNGIKITLSTVYQLKNINLDELLNIVKQHLPTQNTPSPVPVERKKNRRVFKTGRKRGSESPTALLPQGVQRTGQHLSARHHERGGSLPHRTGHCPAPRFSFKKMPPRPDLLLCNSGFSLADVLSVFNRRIAVLLDQDRCIGNAPFLTLPKDNVPVRLWPPSSRTLCCLFLRNISLTTGIKYVLF